MERYAKKKLKQDQQKPHYRLVDLDVVEAIAPAAWKLPQREVPENELAEVRTLPCGRYITETGSTRPKRRDSLPS